MRAGGRSGSTGCRRASRPPGWSSTSGEPTTRSVETGIRTDVDLREGQKAVIGKTTIEGGAEAIFVVVDGAIVE